MSPDLFSAKPVVLSGRYLNGGRGVIRLKGRAGGSHFEREIAVELPEGVSREGVFGNEAAFAPGAVAKQAVAPQR